MTDQANDKVTIRGLSKSYYTRSGDLLALRDINLEIGSNKFITVVGTSGCGKSTLLSIAAGLQDPTDGEILVDGAPVIGPGCDRGVVLQTYHPVSVADRPEEHRVRTSRRARHVEQAARQARS